jgi:hypothetical protein
VIEIVVGSSDKTINQLTKHIQELQLDLKILPIQIPNRNTVRNNMESIKKHDATIIFCGLGINALVKNFIF